MRSRGETLDLTFRLDQEIDIALSTYCDRGKRRVCDVVTEAVAYFAQWLKNDGPKSLTGKIYVFLPRGRKTKRKTVVRGTVLSKATLGTLGAIKMRSIGRTINEALRFFFWDQEKNRVGPHDITGVARFRAALPYGFGDDAEVGFRLLPRSQVLLQDQTDVPSSIKGAPILIGSSYLLGLMLRRTRPFYLDAEDIPVEGSLGAHAFCGDVVLSTTTAQIAEFAEKAAGFLTAQQPRELKAYFASSLGQELPRGLNFLLAERLKALPSLGIAIFPVEAEDYAHACTINRGNWPVTLAKLAGIAAMKRITGKADVFCLSLYRTERIPAIHVWERFTDGYCVEASSCHQSYANYHADHAKEHGQDAAEKSYHLNEKKNPYFRNFKV